MMKETDGFDIRKIITESQRSFTLKCVSFENGLLILVAEGSDRIGSLTVSIRSSKKSNTATVTPSKYHSVFINTVSERVASTINGICIVSFYSMNRLNLEDMEEIMEESMHILREKAL